MVEQTESDAEASTFLDHRLKEHTAETIDMQVLPGQGKCARRGYEGVDGAVLARCYESSRKHFAHCKHITVCVDGSKVGTSNLNSAAVCGKSSITVLTLPARAPPQDCRAQLLSAV